MLNAEAHTSNRRAIRHTARAGFTLIEIMVVVAIIAILATLVAPRVWQAIGRSNSRAALSETRVISQAVGLYLLDNNMSRPPEDFELEVLVSGSDPYLNKVEDLIDPWGNPYVIIVPGEVNHDYDIVSFGADGEPGGEGDAADIVNE